MTEIIIKPPDEDRKMKAEFTGHTPKKSKLKEV